MTFSEFNTEWHNSLDYIVAHTSGSTGTPKEIHLPKADMLSSAKATNAFFGINESSVLGLPLSMDYIAGKMMAVRALAAGCSMLEMPVSNHVEPHCNIDLLSVVPTQLPSILENETIHGFIGNLLVGGAPLDAAAEQQLNATGIKAWLGYGMTETCSHVALRRVGGDGFFSAMPGIEFTTAPDGRLIIRSNRFSWNELVTNDIVDLIDNTRFRWLGRADNVVNSGGIKLHPEQLEQLYRATLPSLPPFYLKGEPDIALGQRLVMITEGEHPDLLDLLRSHIGNHRIIPKTIIAVERLPRTYNGKIKRL